MEKLNTSNQIQEQYENITVAAFMEQYANALQGNQIREPLEAVREEFPKELDDRCRKLIAQAQWKLRRKQILRSCMRVCRSAAVLALVLLCVGTTLFFTVESFRIPFLNLIVEKTDSYMEIHTLSQGAEQLVVPMDVDFNDPLRLVLESDFQLVEVANHWDNGMLSAEYESANATVWFFVAVNGGVHQIDTEDAKISTPNIMDRKVMMVEEGNRYIMVWLDEEKGETYELITKGMSNLDAVELCALVIQLFEG